MNKEYSIQKGASNTIVNSVPVFVTVIANLIVKKFNIPVDAETLNAILLAGSSAFYWLKNYIKNKNA